MIRRTLGEVIRSIWLLFGIIWLFVGLVILLVGVWLFYDERRFAREGVETEGIVLVKGIDRATQDGEDTTEYWVRYRFTTRDRGSFEGRSSVSVEQWERLEERGPIRIHYVESDPTHNRLYSGSDWWGPAIFLSLGVLFSGGGAYAFARGLRETLRRRRLATEGRLTEGTVVSVDQTAVQINGIFQYQISYSYQDETGMTHESFSDHVSPEEANRWSQGDTGRVRYDRTNPAMSIWLGREE